MKRTVIMLVLLLALLTGTAPSYQEVVKKVKCPLCGTPVVGTVVTNGTRTGLRLDLKPIGDLIIPSPVLVCPSCSFVLFEDHLSPVLRDSLNGFVRSEAYRNELPGNTSYYLLAKIGEFRKMPDKDIAHTYLNASWQTEDDTARYHRYLDLALQFYSKAKAGAKDKTNEEYVSLCLQECELLRILGRFDQAGAVLSEMKKNYLLNLEDFDKALKLKKTLIEEKNGKPQVMDWKKQKIDLVDHENQIYGLAGFDQMQAAFEIDSLYYGNRDNDVRHYSSWFYGTHVSEGKWFLVAVLQPLVPGLPDRTLWYIDYDRKKLLQNWQDFLKTQREISAKVNSLVWLRQWQKADSGKVVETRFLGNSLNAISDMDKEKVSNVWAHAGLKGSPDYQLKLFRQDRLFCTVYLGAKEDRALICTAQSGRSNSTRDRMMRDVDSLAYFKTFGAPLKSTHWLDTLEVEYSSIQPVPSYAVVDPDGKYHINGRGRTAVE